VTVKNALLAFDPDVIKQDVPGIAQQLVIGQA
jgi:hypothetical protein